MSLVVWSRHVNFNLGCQLEKKGKWDVLFLLARKAWMLFSLVLQSLMCPAESVLTPQCSVKMHKPVQHLVFGSAEFFRS